MEPDYELEAEGVKEKMSELLYTLLACNQVKFMEKPYCWS